MNLGDVKIRVRRQFGDESSVQIQDDDIARWANDALMHVVQNNEGLLEAVATIDIVTNVQDYPFPTDMFVLSGLTYRASSDLSYIHLQGYSFQEFNSYVDGWDGTLYGPARPFVYTVFANTLKLFPIPNLDAPAGVKVFYNRKPATLVADNDILDLPLIYHNSVVNFCLQQAYEMDENFQAATQKGAQVTSDLQINRDKANGQKNKETYPVIVAMPDDAW